MRRFGILKLSLLLCLPVGNLSVTTGQAADNCGDSSPIRLQEKYKLEVYFCCPRVRFNMTNIQLNDEGGLERIDNLLNSGVISEVFADQERIMFNTSSYGRINVYCSNHSHFVELPFQNPMDPLNGRVTIHYGDHYATATFECDDNFTLDGDEHRTFERNESAYWNWNGTDPVCIANNVTEGSPTELDTDSTTESPTNPPWEIPVAVGSACGLVVIVVAVVLLVVAVVIYHRNKPDSQKRDPNIQLENQTASGPPPLPQSRDRSSSPPLPPSIRHRQVSGKEVRKPDSSQPLLVNESEDTDSDSSRVFREDIVVRFERVSSFQPFLNPSRSLLQHSPVIKLENHGKKDKSSLPVNMPSTTPTSPPVSSPREWNQDLVSQYMHRLAVRVGSTEALRNIDAIQGYMNQINQMQTHESEGVDKSRECDDGLEPQSDDMVAQSGEKDTTQEEPGCHLTTELSEEFQGRLQKLDPEMLCSYSASSSRVQVSSGKAYIDEC